MDKLGLSRKLRANRGKIDLIDQKVLSLLNKRLSVALEIGKGKKQMGKKTFDPKREEELLRRLNSSNRGPLKQEDVERIFKTVIKVCRKAQD
jgi:chorismate mutase-like protein